MALEWYCSDGKDFYNVLSIAEHAQLIVLPRPILDAGDGSSSLLVGDGTVSDVVVVVAVDDDWNLNGVVTAAEVKKNGL